MSWSVLILISKKPFHSSLFSDIPMMERVSRSDRILLVENEFGQFEILSKERIKDVRKL